MPTSHSDAPCLPRAARRLPFLLVAILLSACAARPSLVPAPEANRVAPGGTIARASDAGVTITVDPDAWRGGVRIENVVTPMRITIENKSDRKLRVSYADFALEAQADERFAALPPYDIHATVAGPAPAYRYSPVDRLAFSHHGFQIAPFYHYMYPSLSVWDGHVFYFDPRYYGTHYPYWGRTRVELPTAEMLRYALPEGVLEEGGSVAGFLFFEHVDTDLTPPEVTFRAQVVDIVSDETITTLEVPFVIHTEE